MLDLGFVRDNRQLVERKLKARGVVLDLSDFYSQDEQRRNAIREVEELRHRSNVVSKEIGEAQRKGENVDARKEEMRKVKKRIKELDEAFKQAESRMTSFLLNVPNLTHDSVPLGTSPADN